MASTITQFAAFKFATAVSAPRVLANAVRETYPGVRRQFFGRGVLDPQLNFWLIDREPESTPVDINSLLRKHVDSEVKPTFSHSLSFLREPLEKSISYPVTEVIYSLIKEETDIEAFAEITDLSLVPTEAFPGCPGSSWNYTKEDPRTLLILIGWDKIETHKAFSKTEEFRVTTEPWEEGALMNTVKVDYYKFEEV